MAPFIKNVLQLLKVTFSSISKPDMRSGISIEGTSFNTGTILYQLPCMGRFCISHPASVLALLTNFWEVGNQRGMANFIQIDPASAASRACNLSVILPAYLK